MRITTGFGRSSIGKLILQIAILAYLFFTIDAECRDIGWTPEELFNHYLSDWRLEDRGGIGNLLWFINTPIAINALLSIKQFNTKEAEGSLYSVVFILFYFYNALFCVWTLVYSLWISSHVSAFQCLHLFVAAGLGLLAIPIGLILLAHIVRQVFRREFRIMFLELSTTLIVIFVFCRVLSAWAHPVYL